MADPFAAQLYEIKTVLEASTGAGHIQLGLYLSILNTFDRTGRWWVPGTTYTPPPVMPIVPGVFALVDPPAVGVIQYCAIDARVVTALAAAGIGVALAASQGYRTGQAALQGA